MGSLSDKEEEWEDVDPKGIADLQDKRRDLMPLSEPNDAEYVKMLKILGSGFDRNRAQSGDTMFAATVNAAKQVHQEMDTEPN